MSLVSMEAIHRISLETRESHSDPLVPMVLAAQAGDREAFGSLVEAVWVQLVRLARSILAPAGDDAEDLVQDALLEAWKKLPLLRDPGAVRPWLHRSVARRCYRAAKRPRLAPMPDTAVDAPGHLERDVERLLCQLTPRQRSVFYLSAIAGWKDAEIALHLGMMRPTVRVHRMQARRRLRQLLGDFP